MIVYGLEGKSGTGKSYQAMNVCRDRAISGIIDDGLFIYDNAVRAGHSAKRDKNKMTAIKTAIFNDEKERREVAATIRKIAPESILVLGTSESMIYKICDRLELPEPAEIIHIEDLVDEDAIATALRQRREMGKHVIPVPAVELKPQFSGYFMAPINMFKRKNGKRTAVAEKSVVRPTYSYLGDFTISDRAVTELMTHTARHSKGVSDVFKCTAKNRQNGVTLTAVVAFEYSRDLRRYIITLQQNLAREVEEMTAFNILGVNIIVKGLKPVEQG